MYEQIESHKNVCDFWLILYRICYRHRSPYGTIIIIMRKSCRGEKNIEYKEICWKRNANKEEPITLVSHFFLFRFSFLLFHSFHFLWNTFGNFFNIMHNLRKLYALKKVIKTILYIFTHRLTVYMCSASFKSAYRARNKKKQTKRPNKRVNKNEKKMKQASE